MTATAPAPTPAKPKSERAYLLRFCDLDNEPCAIVYAVDARAARRQYHVIDGADYMHTSATPAPQFDAGSPSTEALLRDHGWWFTCAKCGDPARLHEGEPPPVVLDDCGYAGTVAHAKCAGSVAR